MRAGGQNGGFENPPYNVNTRISDRPKKRLPMEAFSFLLQ